VSRVNHLVDLNRVTQWSGVDFSQLVVFLVGRRWTFSSDFYRRAAVHFPMKLHWAVVGVGRSSIDMMQSIYEDVELSTEPLAASIGRIVSVDPSTTKPAPLPAPIFDSLAAAAAAANGDGGTRRYEPLRTPSDVPATAFTCRVRVRYDDMDLILHTNQGSYLEFVLECAAQAAESGYYSVVCGDVAFRRVRTIASNFLSVSQAGDELEVSTWEDAVNRFLLHFVIRKGGQSIYYAQIEYGDEVVD